MKTGEMKWSVVQYLGALKRMGKCCTGMQEHVEGELLDLFPPETTETIVEPWIRKGLFFCGFYRDCCIRIERWVGYHIGYVTFIDFEKEYLWDTLNIIQKRLTVKPQSTSWRVNVDYYHSPTECKYKPGSVSFGLAWYQQGMKVSIWNA